LLGLNLFGGGPHKRGAPTFEASRAAFAFTGREAEVAPGLALGGDVDAIAAALRIKPETPRPYTKKLLRKTNTHRPAALLALLKEPPGE
jgi:DNA-binding NarL/FixJ family response regulator